MNAEYFITEVLMWLTEILGKSLTFDISYTEAAGSMKFSLSVNFCQCNFSFIFLSQCQYTTFFQKGSKYLENLGSSSYW